jgi:hypothetical protein
LLAFTLSIRVRPGWIPAHIAGIGALLAAAALGWTRAIDPNRIETALIGTGVLVLVVIGDEVLWNRRAARDRQS